MGAARKPGKTLLFDTLAYVKKLEAVGIPQKHAEAQVFLLSQILEENICSKHDLLEAEGRLEVQLKETEGRIRVEIEEIRKNVKELEFKIENVRKDLTIQISESKSDIIKWFIGTFFVSMGVIMGFATLLLRLSHG